jgi:hypothetical protein
VPRLRHLVPLALGAVLLAAGCGVPPDLQPKPGVAIPTTQPQPSPTGFGFPQPSASTTTSASPVPSPVASFPELYYVPCLGRPSGEQVIATVRSKTRLLPRTGTISVTTGPLCSGTWQYTNLLAPNKDPLLVVTKGSPTALTIVTAGSDVCTIGVRTQAPAGLLAAARC